MSNKNAIIIIDDKGNWEVNFLQMPLTRNYKKATVRTVEDSIRELKSYTDKYKK